VSGQASSPAKKVSSRKASNRKKVARSRRTRRRGVQGQRTIESARVVEIQNALAAAGYYREQPNGQWDDHTAKAMSSYQQDNGFKITGKPDALSLKKLGL
jgi:peptidoglycan hydrolase-like protein with peptidoglycan-binding domain